MARAYASQVSKSMRMQTVLSGARQAIVSKRNRITMQHTSRRHAFLVVLILLLVPLVSCIRLLVLERPYSNPSVSFQDSYLVGTWETVYLNWQGFDRIIVRADGTFKQIYQNPNKGYTYETPWNEWMTERFSD